MFWAFLFFFFFSSCCGRIHQNIIIVGNFLFHFSKHFRTCFDSEMIHLSHGEPLIKSHHTSSPASRLRPPVAASLSHLTGQSLVLCLAVSATSSALFHILPAFFFLRRRQRRQRRAIWRELSFVCFCFCLLFCSSASHLLCARCGEEREAPALVVIILFRGPD